MNVVYGILVSLMFLLLSDFTFGQIPDSILSEATTKEGKERVDYLNDIAYYFPEHSLSHAEEALQLAEKLNYAEGIARAWDMLGEHYIFVGDFEKFREYRSEAIDLYLKLNEKELAFLSLIPLIYLDIEELKYFDALRQGMELQNLASEINDSVYLADSKVVLSRIYGEGMLNLNLSMRLLLEAKGIYEHYSEKKELIGVYNDLGAGYDEAGNLDSAAYYYQKGLESAQQLYNKDPEFDNADLYLLLSNRADIFIKKGKFEKGLEYAREALALHEDESFSFYYPSILTNVGAAYLGMDSMDLAKEYLHEAHREAAKVNSTYDLSEIYRHFKEIHIKENNFEKAFEFQKLFRDARDTLYNGERAATMEIIRAEYELKKIARQNELLNERLKLIAIIGVLLIFGLLATWFFYRKLQSKNKTIQRQNVQLAKLNETKDRLFAIIAHDFKTPLLSFQNLTSNIAYLLKKGQTERVLKMGHAIEENALILKRQTDNLLNWAMSQTGQIPYKPERFSLQKLAEENIGGFLNLVKAKKIEIIWKAEENLWVFADKQAILLVIRNLFSNALKFTDEGGEIKISAVNLGDFVRLTVCDSGVGIPPEKLPGIFRLDNQKSTPGTGGEKGTGLGLAVCKELTELNKGKISVESTVGKGTKIILLLPVCQEPDSV